MPFLSAESLPEALTWVRLTEHNELAEESWHRWMLLTDDEINRLADHFTDNEPWLDPFDMERFDSMTRADVEDLVVSAKADFNSDRPRHTVDRVEHAIVENADVSGLCQEHKGALEAALYRDGIMDFAREASEAA